MEQDTLGGFIQGYQAQQPQMPQMGMAPAINGVEGVGPPRGPQELEQRKQGWMQLLPKMMESPQVQAAMLQMGRMIGAPAQLGESTGGRIANTLMGGMQAYGMVGQDLEHQNQTRQMFGAKLAQENAQTEGIQARTTDTRQNTQFNAEMQPGRVEGQRLENQGREARNRETQLDIDFKEKTVNTRIQQLELEMKLREEQLKRAPLETDKARLEVESARLKNQLDALYGVRQRLAQIRQSEAAAASSGAAAALHSEQAKGIRAENQREDEVYQSLTPEERKQRSMRTLAPVSSGSTGAQEMNVARLIELKKQDPGFQRLPPEQQSAELTRFETDIRMKVKSPDFLRLRTQIAQGPQGMRMTEDQITAEALKQMDMIQGRGGSQAPGPRTQGRIRLNSDGSIAQ